jgi:hypothetical protein
MSTSRRLAKFVPACALLALAIPSSAFGQATRTWVSGTGDDANPCSRTAPCKTFAGAISKTAAKGEINVIDPGGFGAVTINKSITIKAEAATAGVLTNVNNAININAGANDKVKLFGLDINGLGTATSGVKIIQAKTVVVRNSQIYEFAQNGIDIRPNNVGMHVVVTDVHIHDIAGDGILAAPTAAGNDLRVDVRRSDIEDSFCGVAATSFGLAAAPNFASECGTNSAASGINSKVTVNVFGSGIFNNGNGVYSRGAQSTDRIGDNDIADNFNGLLRTDAGAIVSFGDNRIDGNNTNGAASSTVARSKRHG